MADDAAARSRPPTRMETGGDVVGAALAAAGATHAFGLPGGEVLALVEGLERAGVRFVLARHENAAGFMAEGLWHATGALPVLVATLGPGVANAVNVVANAAQDRVPLVFLTGCVDAGMAASYTHQIFDHQALLRPLVKLSLRVEPGRVGAAVAEAVAVALSGQPGPVHLDLPIGVAEGAAVEAPRRPVAPTPPSPEPAALARARAMLGAARRPLVIAGLDAVNEGAGDAVAAFCREHSAPLMTTYKGKGLMAEDDPLCLGGFGLSPRADAIALPLIAEADCVVLAGYDPIEMRQNWRFPWPAAKPVIDIAPAPRAHGMHAATETLLGPVGPTLAALGPGRPDRWPDGAPAQARAALAAAFAPGPAWGPARAFHALRAALPPQTVATADSGAHRILFSQIWRCGAPRTLLQSSGLCTMGCAVPLAAGYKLGRPDSPVIAVVGDAGVEMCLGELATLRDAGTPVVVVVLVDGSLALIELKQRAGQRPNAGVDFGVSDLPAVARAMGGEGRWIDDADTLAAEAQAALGRDAFTLLAVRIPRRAYDGLF